jgi:hypothetical protein
MVTEFLNEEIKITKMQMFLLLFLYSLLAIMFYNLGQQVKFDGYVCFKPLVGAVMP